MDLTTMTAQVARKALGLAVEYAEPSNCLVYTDLNNHFDSTGLNKYFDNAGLNNRFDNTGLNNRFDNAKQDNLLDKSEQTNLSDETPVVYVAPKYTLYARPLKVENRVETECDLELILSGPKVMHKNVHLAPNSVWLAKNLASPSERELRKDTLELSAVVVAVTDYEAAANAFPPVDSVQNIETGLSTFPPGLAPIQICGQCQTREQARKNRKKNTLDTEFDSYINQRIIGIAAKEYSQLQPYHPDKSQPWDKFAADRPSTHVFTQPEFGAERCKFQAGMRILCKCNHHREAKGFFVRFTLRDYSGRVVAETTSSSVMVKDVAKKRGTTARDTRQVNAQKMVQDAQMAHHLAEIQVADAEMNRQLQQELQSEMEAWQYMPSPQMEPCQSQPSPQMETCEFQPLPQMETCQSQPSPQMEACQYMPSPQMETCEFQPSPQMETCQSQPSLQMETCQFQTSPQMETCEFQPLSHMEQQEMEIGYQEMEMGQEDVVMGEECDQQTLDDILAEWCSKNQATQDLFLAAEGSMNPQPTQEAFFTEGRDVLMVQQLIPRTTHDLVMEGWTKIQLTKVDFPTVERMN
jgi:hypothetical protein